MSIINTEKPMKMVAIFNVFAFLFNSSVDNSVRGCCGFICLMERLTTSKLSVEFR